MERETPNDFMQELSIWCTEFLNKKGEREQIQRKKKDLGNLEKDLKQQLSCWLQHTGQTCVPITIGSKRLFIRSRTQNSHHQIGKSLLLNVVDSLNQEAIDDVHELLIQKLQDESNVTVREVLEAVLLITFRQHQKYQRTYVELTTVAEKGFNGRKRKRDDIPESIVEISQQLLTIQEQLAVLKRKLREVNMWIERWTKIDDVDSDTKTRLKSLQNLLADKEGNKLRINFNGEKEGYYLRVRKTTKIKPYPIHLVTTLVSSIADKFLASKQIETVDDLSAALLTGQQELLDLLLEDIASWKERNAAQFDKISLVKIPSRGNAKTTDANSDETESNEDFE